MANNLRKPLSDSESIVSVKYAPGSYMIPNRFAAKMRNTHIASGGQRTTFFPSTIWVPDIELRFWGLSVLPAPLCGLI